MAEEQTSTFEYEINQSTYDWSVRVFRTLKKLLSVNVKLHSEKEKLEQGEIFLFNHFARFETFIPQYLIYEETGAYCCSVAHSEFFEGDVVLSNYLRAVGAIPHDHENLLAILTEQILRGRKVIIFPEGGMVKDRQVIDAAGEFSIFSRTSMDRRKQHTGAAVLGLGVDAFKKTIRQTYYAGNIDRLQQWASEFHFEKLGDMLTAALRPTVIIPANITFYPMRINDNILRKGAELLNKGLTRRHSEELLIEGNILLKDTDMDIRLGTPVKPGDAWHWWENKLIDQLAPNIKSIGHILSLRTESETKSERVLAKGILRNAKKLRNVYMENMYETVTVNLSHLAASIIMNLVNRGKSNVNREHFYKALYLSVKTVQQVTSIHLHRSLQNPEEYGNLIEGNSKRLEQFIRMAESSGLVESDQDRYRFLPKLLEDQDFDTIRTENLIAVYSNEVAPIQAVANITEKAFHEAEQLSHQDLAALYFDDEVVSWRWDKAYFAKPCFDDINDQETADQNAQPFFIRPHNRNGIGVVVIHGFLASPAEVRGFADRLAQNGFTTIGVRLKGHGTSPKDLRETSWQEWYESVVRCYKIMQGYTDRIMLVGFSTGGALALQLAADQPDGLEAIAVVSVPIKFRDAKMMFVPLVHGTNKLVGWLSSYEGVRPFLQNVPEHPDINYQNIPVRGLYELRLLIGELEKRLADVHCPTLILQGDNDPTVDPKSAEIIYKKLSSVQKELVTIDSRKHGILMDNIGFTQEKLLSFLTERNASTLAPEMEFTPSLPNP